MGPWRASMGRAIGRLRYAGPSTASSSPFFSCWSLVEGEQHQLRCPTPFARFGTYSRESRDACAHLNEPSWQDLGLGFPLLIFAQKNAQENAEALLEDAKDFLLDSNPIEGLVRLDLRSAEGSMHTLEHRKASLIARLQAELAARTLSSTKPWPNACSSLHNAKVQLMGFAKHDAPKYLESFFLQSSTCDSVIRAPGLNGSEDIIIQADSVKRKRKKKMNKHKHRKLRRLARKSRK